MKSDISERARLSPYGTFFFFFLSTYYTQGIVLRIVGNLHHSPAL